MPIVRTQARRLYKCDCCERASQWDDGWAWFGSWRALDEDQPIITTCSADCRIKMVADNRLPHEGIDDSGNVVDDQAVTAKHRKSVSSKTRGGAE